MRSPLAKLSILCTISILKGPPSSFSCGWLARWLAAGRRFDGVFGIGTGEFIILCISTSDICGGLARLDGTRSTVLVAGGAGSGGGLEELSEGVLGWDIE
jgi:hypothetical protein